MGSRRLLLWCVLLGLAAVPWLRPGQTDTRTSPVAKPAPHIQAPDPALPPLSDLRDTILRPLFSASRRPMPDAAPKAAPPAPTRLAGYRVTGIVRSSAKRMILLMEERTGKVVELREGDTVDGWTLISIGAESVRMTRDGREFDLLEDTPATTTGGAPSTARDTRWLPSGGAKK